jgi:hypothetical protein
MAQMQNAQSVALQLEKVRNKLPRLYERDDILLTRIQLRGDVERVSSRNLRLPLQIRPGGKAGLANLDGGDLGRGSGTTYDVVQVTAVFFRHAAEITKLVEYSINSPEKAIENAAKREVKKQHGAVPQLSRQSGANRRQRRVNSAAIANGTRMPTQFSTTLRAPFTVHRLLSRGRKAVAPLHSSQPRSATFSRQSLLR